VTTGAPGVPEGLERFVTAQDRVWREVVAELTAGAKRSHWMWFVFPQLRGLGHSSMAARYGLQSLAEARAYLDHPVLGPRLRQAVDLMLSHGGRRPEAVLGGVDALKLRSCLTLFAVAAPSEGRFGEALAAFFDGPDPLTLARLADA